jgi:hypothetical protein
MSAAQRIDDYLDETLENLEDDGFEVFEDARYRGRDFEAVATRTKGMGTGHHDLVFVFAMFRRLTESKLEEFTRDAYDYAERNRGSSWPVGINNMLWVYPVALAEEFSDRAYDQLLSEKPRVSGFGYIAFPVVYAADSDEVVYYDGDWDGVGHLGMNRISKYARDYLDLD